MHKGKLLHYIAPCSLLCYTCPGLTDGVIAACAAKLCRHFEGYYEFNDANLPAEYRGWLPEFEKLLAGLGHYSRPGCPGCRNNPSGGTGCVEGCVVPDCALEHKVDFCAECAEFPCERAATFFETVNGVIGRDWLNGNRRIREAGIEKYFEERKELSHYISWKKMS